MLDIYINGKKVDLGDNTTIALTYKATDLDKPTAQKNAFSKSIELKGTPTNNKIFGEIYNMDRIIADGTVNVGASFDPTQRVDCTIYNDTVLVDSGYICLDTIKINNGIITYSITYYSALGDFFYNLMYNNNSSEKRTLADMYYGFQYEDADGNKVTYPLERTMAVDAEGNPKTDIYGNIIYIESEGEAKLFQWDTDYICEGWEKLFDNRDNTDMTPSNWIVAAPTYSGLYEDFDNDKVLVNTHQMPYATDWFPTTDSKGNKTYDGFAIATASRDLSEWETRALNSANQRPAVKFSLILEAISNPMNNGGYTIKWDKDILDDSTNLGKYYNNSYLMFNKFDKDNVMDFNSDNLSISGITNICDNEIKTITIVDEEGNSSFNLSNYKRPSVQISVQTQVNLTNEQLGNETPDAIYSSYVYAGGNNSELTLNCYQLVAEYSDGSESDFSPVYAVYSSCSNLEKNLKEDGVYEYEQKNIEESKNKVAELFGTDSSNLVYKNVDCKKTATSPTYTTYADDDFSISLNGFKPKQGVSFKLKAVTVKFLYKRYASAPENIHQFFYNDKNYITYKFFTKKDSRGWKSVNSPIILPSTYRNENTVNNYYDGRPVPSNQRIYIDKNALFGDKGSPYDYLVGFARLFGLKFITDGFNKTIDIMQRDKYYQINGDVEIVDFDNNIDRSKEITIDPCLTESKWLKYGLETPETYAQFIYNKNNGNEYGNYLFDTKYNFNNDTEDLFEDTVFKNYAPFTLNSIFFNSKSVPQVALAKTYTYTLFNDDYEPQETVKYGYSATNVIKNEYDMFPKICCFDKDNKDVTDLDNCLVLFDGFNEWGDEGGDVPFIVYDNLQQMKDVNGNFCHLYSECPYDENGNKICTFRTLIPRFEKYVRENNNIVVSYDFVKPNDATLKRYIVDDATYSDDKALMLNFWFPYSSDLYNKNGRSVELYVTKISNPQLAMRRFYYFDNSLWIINEITDYDPTSNASTKVTFVKIKDIESYVGTYNQIIRLKGNPRMVSNDNAEKLDVNKKYNIFITLNDGNVLVYNDTSVTMNMIPNEQRPKVVSADIGDGVQSIGDNAFAYCTAITSVSISNTVKTIGESAFDSCTSLTSIDIPNSVTNIKDSVFDTCTALTTLRLGSGITTLGSGLFIRADLLKAIYYNGTKSQFSSIRKKSDWLQDSSVEDIFCTDGVIHISDTSIDSGTVTPIS